MALHPALKVYGALSPTQGAVLARLDTDGTVKAPRPTRAALIRLGLLERGEPGQGYFLTDLGMDVARLAARLRRINLVWKPATAERWGVAEDAFLGARRVGSIWQHDSRSGWHASCLVAPNLPSGTRRMNEAKQLVHMAVADFLFDTGLATYSNPWLKEK